jgi:hypothetical protein
LPRPGALSRRPRFQHFSFQHFSFSHCRLAIPLTFTPTSATLLAMSSSFQTGSGISALLGPLPAEKRFLVNP